MRSGRADNLYLLRTRKVSVTEKPSLFIDCQVYRRILFMKFELDPLAFPESLVQMQLNSANGGISEPVSFPEFHNSLQYSLLRPIFLGNFLWNWNEHMKSIIVVSNQAFYGARFGIRTMVLFFTLFPLPKFLIPQSRTIRLEK